MSAASPSAGMRRRVALLAAAALAVVAAGSTLAVAQESQGGGQAGEVEDGERVFRAECAMCHGADASGMMGMHPSLRGSVARLSREGVEVTIRQGRRTQPPMPAFEGRLTSDEIDAVVAYIASLPEGPRNFGPGEDGGMMGGDGMMMDDGVDASDIALVLLAVLAVAGLAVGVVVITRTRGSPQRVLDRRYAAGELSRDEYLQRRRDLQEG